MASSVTRPRRAACTSTTPTTGTSSFTTPRAWLALSARPPTRTGGSSGTLRSSGGPSTTARRSPTDRAPVVVRVAHAFTLRGGLVTRHVQYPSVQEALEAVGLRE